MDERCPKCGGEMTFGYGLAGGGIGGYVMCLEDSCDYFKKEQDKDAQAPEDDGEEAKGDD